MKKYEVKMSARKNARIALTEDPVYIVVADNKKQAADFAYEIYASEDGCTLSRNMFKITAEVYNEN